MNKMSSFAKIVMVSAIIFSASSLQARGVRGVAGVGVGAPGVGVRDPGINQPGAAGNVGVGVPGVGVGAPGVGVYDPGINQPGAAGNVGVYGAGVAARRIVATSVYVAALPPSCVNVVVNGQTLQQCGGIYYQQSGDQYMVVNVE